MNSKACNTNDPKYSKLTIGVCPDQWGVWFPDDPKQMDPRQAWQEMAEAGFEIIETGPYGYFPTDPKELQKWCDEFGMRVVAGTGWGILHKPEAWETTLKTFRAIAETHAAVGAEYIVHLPPLYRDDKTWEWTDDRVLSDDAWKLYVEHANALGQMLLDEYGLKMVLHSHGDSHIETPDEIARIFAATDPTYVNLCLDSGHVVYGGGDPVELCHAYPDRINYVHIKAFDADITREAHEKDWPFGEAVTKGASVCPPQGLPEMHSFVDALAELDKPMYAICEQDCYPCNASFPKQNAIAMREYLASCGLGIKWHPTHSVAEITMTVRIGLIGAGGMGRAHAERITTELSGGRIVAVADINLDNAKVVAEPLGAKAYSSGGGGGELIADPGIDAVLVATFGKVHAPTWSPPFALVSTCCVRSRWPRRPRTVWPFSRLSRKRVENSSPSGS